MRIVYVERSVSYTLLNESGQERNYVLTKSNECADGEDMVNISDGNQGMNVPVSELSFLMEALRLFVFDEQKGVGK